MSIAQRFLHGLIWLYRHTLAYWLGGRCRFTPSCSTYATDAVRSHGAWRGGWMAVKRIGRCHPIKWLGGGSGFDPVP